MTKKVFVVTDPGLDPDDIVAAWLMASLHKLGLIEIVGTVANMDPSPLRAQLLKGVYTDLGVDIPVGIGSDCNCSHASRPYEFSYLGMSSNVLEGQRVWGNMIAEAEDKSITLVLISGLTDIAWAISTFPQIVQKVVKEVYIMGGASWVDGRMVADPTASNNKFDKTLDPQTVYDFFIDNGIPLKILTRFAAYAAGITPEFYEDVKDINPVGAHLHKIQQSALMHLWQFACSNPPEHRQNRQWYSQTFCGLPDLPISAEENPWPYVKKLALYDPLTVMWMQFPQVFNPSGRVINGVEHQIVGVSADTPGIPEPDVVIAKLKTFLKQDPWS